MNNEKILNNLRIEIKKYGTQEEFAKKLYINSCSLSRILNGRRNITLDFVIRVCEITGKTPNEVLCYE